MNSAKVIAPRFLIRRRISFSAVILDILVHPNLGESFRLRLRLKDFDLCGSSMNCQKVGGRYGPL